MQVEHKDGKTNSRIDWCNFKAMIIKFKWSLTDSQQSMIVPFPLPDNYFTLCPSLPTSNISPHPFSAVPLLSILPRKLKPSKKNSCSLALYTYPSSYIHAHVFFILSCFGECVRHTPPKAHPSSWALDPTPHKNTALAILHSTIPSAFPIVDDHPQQHTNHYYFSHL